MKNIILLLLLSASASALAQKFHQGKLYFADGKTMEGLVEIPKDPYDKTIAYKKKDSDSKTTFNSNELKTVTIFVDDSTQFEFSREIAKKPVSKTKYKILDPAWLTVLV